MRRHKPWFNMMMITVGAFIMGFSIKNMYDPVNLVTGGFSGISIIVKSLHGFPLWLTTAFLNIPLFMVAVALKGWRYVSKTLFATSMLSLALYVVPDMPLVDDLLLVSLFGGITSGIGFGLILMCNATTGGTDLLAALIQRKLKMYSLVEIMQVLDGLIVIAGIYLFGIKYAMYALIAIYAAAKVSDGMLEGMKFSKQAFIISDRSEEISRAVMEEMNRGVTSVQAMGMYSRQNRQMLFCVVSKKEIVQLKELVQEIDPRAFVIVSDAREVLGEGFIEY